MFSVVGWSLALLLWVVRDARPIPEILSIRTDHDVEIDDCHNAGPDAIARTYWIMKGGEVALRTTDRSLVAEWIRQHGTRGLKILTTVEREDF